MTLDDLNGHTLTVDERMAAALAAQDLVRRLQMLPKAPQREAALATVRWLLGSTGEAPEARVA